jgi:hypothetical protein
VAAFVAYLRVPDRPSLRASLPALPGREVRH